MYHVGQITNTQLSADLEKYLKLPGMITYSYTPPLFFEPCTLRRAIEKAEFAIREASEERRGKFFYHKDIFNMVSLPAGALRVLLRALKFRSETKEDL